jgi:hypothetical protein
MQQRPSITISSDLGVTSTSRCNDTEIITSSCIPCSILLRVRLQIIFVLRTSNMLLSLDNGQLIILSNSKDTDSISIWFIYRDRWHFVAM